MMLFVCLASKLTSRCMCMLQGDSYMLALSRPEATLKAWHPIPCLPLLEGQGLGTFLGPPAQRWAAAVALKDGTNVLPNPDKQFGNGVMSRWVVVYACYAL